MPKRTSHLTHQDAPAVARRRGPATRWGASAAALLAVVVSLALAGCSAAPSSSKSTITPAGQAASAPAEASPSTVGDIPSASSVSGDAFLTALPSPTDTDLAAGYVTLNGNEPSFTTQDATTVAFQTYSPLDSLGRCGPASACLGPETLPTEERGDIHEVHPSGWQSSSYDFVDGGSLYNRSHLIAFSLSGQNANERNLITGTRHMNADVMRPIEEMVADYIRQTSNHVLYRVTPVFSGSELVARGVQMEARSMEDSGQGIELNVYLFNTQPGVTIDYTTGNNWADASGGTGGTSTGAKAAQAVSGGATANASAANASAATGAAAPGAPSEDVAPDEQPRDFVVNTRSKKFHAPDCPSVADMSEENRQDAHASVSELEQAGYSPHAECVK